MHYQQFASHAYCGAAVPVSKMTLQQEKDFCVLRFEMSRSVITVQREFRSRFRKDATICTDTAPAWLSKSQHFLCVVPRESARPIFLHWSNCDWRLISRHFGKLVVTPTEHQLWRLHSTTGRCFPPFSQECTSVSQSCSSTALDRTCCKRRQPPSPLATPLAGSNTMRFLSMGVR